MIELLKGESILQLLRKADKDHAFEVGQKPCPHCGGKLNRGNYPRKLRGINDIGVRDSFCCSNPDCRKRVTPGSVRYLGRKVFPATIVVLLSAMIHGLSPRRVGELRRSLGVSRATLNRWRRWWLQTFVSSKFWKMAQARFSPALDQTRIAFDLCCRFNAQTTDGLLNTLRFLRPITTDSDDIFLGF